MSYQRPDVENHRASRVEVLGDFVRAQRRKSQLSLRQLADLTGVSNPYLSQVERGLRKPSVEVLQQLARALHLSADVLYVQAGILQERAPSAGVPRAIAEDSALSREQRQVLTQMYWTFIGEDRDTSGDDANPPGGAVDVGADEDAVATSEPHRTREQVRLD